MNNQEYISAAVELADGWNINLSGIALPWEYDTIWPTDLLIKKQHVLDALAAQLVRQHLKRHTASVYSVWHRDTMKTIKWLVDNQ